MKSVGEVMAIGRSFEEALQKAIRMQSGLIQSVTDNGFKNAEELKKFLNIPTPRRPFAIAESMKRGMSVEEIHRITGIDMWFLSRIENIVNIEKDFETENQQNKKLGKERMLILKQAGFSDKKIGKLCGQTEFQIR